MEDAELNAIRAARLQEMQRQQQGAGSFGGTGLPLGGASAGAAEPSPDDPQQAILTQILTLEAKERLSRVRMVKPDRARAVEGYLIKMAQSGQIRSKVGESDIKEILEQSAAQERQKTRTEIVFDRVDKGQGAVDEDDDDDDFFD